MNIDNVKANLLANESRTNFFYRCTGGKVTIGVGHACESASDACALPLLTSTGSPASADQINAAFAAVAAPLNLRASSYRQYSDLNLPDPAVDQIWNSDIASFTAQLQRRLPNFNSYP